MKFSAAADDRRHGNRAVERLCASELARQAHVPAEGFAQGVGRRAGEHRQRQQAGADDAQREDHEGELAGDRAQRLGGLAEVWMSVMPCAFRVAAVVMMMNSATALESAMPR